MSTTVQLSIRQKVDAAIHEKLSRYPFRIVPTVILVHPNTWIQFVGELASEIGAHSTYGIRKMSYKGIKVTRTFDLAENEVEVH